MQIKHLFPNLKLLLLIALPLILLRCGGENSPEVIEEMTSNEENLAQAAAYADTAQMMQYVLWNWEGAEAFFKKAIDLDPNLGRAHAHYGWLHQLRGDDTKGVVAMKKAIEVEPQNPLWHAWHGWMVMWKDDGSEALEAAQGGLEIDSAFSVSHYVIGTVLKDREEFDKAIEHMEIAANDPRFVFSLGVAHAKAGNTEKALEIAQQLADTGETWNTWGIAEIYSSLEDKEKAMEWVQKAFDQKHPYIPWIEKNPILSILSDQSGYQEIVEAMKLPE